MPPRTRSRMTFHRVSRGRVQARRGLVEKQDAGPAEQAGGQVQAAAHAAGVRPHRPPGRGLQGEQLQQVGRAPLRLPARQAAQLADHHQVGVAAQALV